MRKVSILQVLHLWLMSNVIPRILAVVCITASLVMGFTALISGILSLTIMMIGCIAAAFIFSLGSLSAFYVAKSIQKRKSHAQNFPENE